MVCEYLDPPSEKPLAAQISDLKAELEEAQKQGRNWSCKEQEAHGKYVVEMKKNLHLEAELQEAKKFIGGQSYETGTQEGES